MLVDSTNVQQEQSSLHLAGTDHPLKTIHSKLPSSTGPRGTTQWEPMNEMVFVSNELKSYQNLALRLTRQLQDAYAKIFDLQSENSFLKSELEVMHHNARQD